MNYHFSHVLPILLCITSCNESAKVANTSPSSAGSTIDASASAAPVAAPSASAKSATPERFRKVTLEINGRKVTFLQSAAYPEPLAPPPAVEASKAPFEKQRVSLGVPDANAPNDVKATDEFKQPVVPQVHGAPDIVATNPMASGLPFREILGIEKVIGTNELTRWYQDERGVPEKERIPPQLRSKVKAFGLVSMGCSAVHIGSGIALMAGHCVMKNGDPAMKNAPCPTGQAEISIQWGVILRRKGSNFTVNVPPSDESNCSEIVAAQYDNDVDYAIIRLDQWPDAKIEVDRSGRPSEQMEVTIAGYPLTDLAANALIWSRYCKILPTSALPFRDFDKPSRFAHRCDTEPSSSGSPVIRTDTWSVVGIHNGGEITGIIDGLSVGTNWGTCITDMPIDAIKSDGNGQ